MARLPSAFVVEGEKEMGDRTLIKPGKYLMSIIKTDYKENSNKNGHYVMLEREILQAEDPTLNGEIGKTIQRYLNIDHPNPKTVQIADAEWTTTRKVCGVLVPEDTDELLNIPHWVTVTIQVGKTVNNKKEEDRNQFAAMEPADGAVAIPNKPSNPTSGKTTTEGKSAPRRPVFED